MLNDPNARAFAPCNAETGLDNAMPCPDSHMSMGIVSVKRGMPRTATEWTALIKVASGETDIPLSHCARLFALGLIERMSGVPTLTRHGRLTLGLPE